MISIEKNPGHINLIISSFIYLSRYHYSLGLVYILSIICIVGLSYSYVENCKENTIKGGSYYANWGVLLAWFSDKTYDVSIVGEECNEIRKEFDKHFLPNVFLSGGKNEGKSPLLKDKLISNQTTIYVCQDKACKLPVNEVNKALDQIKDY